MSDATIDPMGQPDMCGLCGYPTLGDFYVAIPGAAGYYMHSVSCGPILVGMEQVAQPTHARRDDGTIERLGQ